MNRIWLVMLLSATLSLLARGTENLVPNGDFEAGANGLPTAWDKPDGLGVTWAAAPDRPGHAIRIDTSVSERDMQASWVRAGLTEQWSIPKPAGNAIADTYGLSYYSTNIPCASGATYRITCDTRGPGPLKVWVRGYGPFRGRRVRRYEAVMNCAASADTWRTTTMDFTPTAQRPEVDELRIMLYAWYPPGVYWFDRVRLERIDTAERE